MDLPPQQPRQLQVRPHGKTFGDVTEWGDDIVLVIDGLTGVSTMSATSRSG